MIFSRFFSTPSKSITGAAFIISVATLASRLCGILRDRIFAHLYGTSPLMDAYYAAFKIPDFIYNLLVVGALTAGFIPTFTKLFFAGDDKDPAWKLANSILNILSSTLFGIALVGFAAAPLLSHLIAPGFAPENQKMVISFTQIMLLSPFFLGLSMVLGGILQSLRQFVLYSIAPIFYNVGIIVGAVWLRPMLGPIGLAWGVVLGAALHCLLQLYGAQKNGYRWQWYFGWKDKATREVWRLMVPRTLGLAASQLNIVGITILASLLPSGSVTVYNYANNLHNLPIGLIGIPFALAVFPLLSQAAGKKNLVEFGEHLNYALRHILFLIIPLATLLFLLRAQIVRVILGTGSFNWADTISTADTLAAFTLEVAAAALLPLLARAFYALSDTKTPFILGVFSEVVTILLSLGVVFFPLTTQFFQGIPGLGFGISLRGVPGLALAVSLGTVLNVVLLYSRVRKIINLDEKKILLLLGKIFIAVMVMALVTQILKTPFAAIVDMTRWWGILLQGAGAGIMGLLAYVGICHLCKVEELTQLSMGLKKRWLKIKPLKEGLIETL